MRFLACTSTRFIVMAMHREQNLGPVAWEAKASAEPDLGKRCSATLSLFLLYCPAGWGRYLFYCPAGWEFSIPPEPVSVRTVRMDTHVATASAKTQNSVFLAKCWPRFRGPS